MKNRIEKLINKIDTLINELGVVTCDASELEDLKTLESEEQAESSEQI